MVNDAGNDEITMDEWQAEMERQLELAAKSHRKSRWPWSQWEREILRKFYGRVPVEVLAEKLGRSIASIYNTAGRENLKVGRGK